MNRDRAVRWGVAASVGVSVLAGAAVLVRYGGSPRVGQDDRVERQPGVGGRGLIAAEPKDDTRVRLSSWRADLPGAQRELVEGYDDLDYRDALVGSLYLRDRLTGDPEEMTLFLSLLQRYDASQPISAAGFDESQTASLSLSFLARAWVQVGPVTGVEAECMREASRLLADRDVIVRTQAAALLEAIRRLRTDHRLPDEAQRLLETALSNDTIRFELGRQLEVLRDAASVVGRDLPGG